VLIDDPEGRLTVCAGRVVPTLQCVLGGLRVLVDVGYVDLVANEGAKLAGA